MSCDVYGIRMGDSVTHRVAGAVGKSDLVAGLDENFWSQFGGHYAVQSNSRLFEIGSPDRNRLLGSLLVSWKVIIDFRRSSEFTISRSMNDKWRLLYALSRYGEIDGVRHAGSLPVRQHAYERHEVVLKGVIGWR